MNNLLSGKVALVTGSARGSEERYVKNLLIRERI